MEFWGYKVSEFQYFGVLEWPEAAVVGTFITPSLHHSGTPALRFELVQE